MESSFRTDQKLSRSTKWYFALGDIYEGGFFNIVNFFYAYFLTDVVGIPAIWAGVIFFVSKVWDAVTDPLTGILSDNTRSRFGRRRIYFLIGAPLVLVSFIMMWFPLSGGTEVSRILFFAFAYMLANTASTIVSVPFLAMSAELSTDYNERTSITNIRMVVSIISSLICAVVPMMIVGLYADVKTGYIVMSIAFGLFFSIPWLLVFAKVKERREFVFSHKGTWKMLYASLKIRSFWKFIVMYLGIVVAMDITSMIFAYYMTYNLGRTGELNFVLGTLLIVEVAFVPLASYVCRTMSKTKSIVIGCIGWMVCALSSMLITPAFPGFAIYLLAAVLGAFMAFALVGFTSLFGDVTDVGELYFGTRVEGSFSGVQQFVRKCAAAAANALALAALSFAGFINPINEVVDGITTSVAQPQSAAVLFTIKAILGLASVALLIPSLVIALRWKLTKERHSKLIEYLDLKRGGMPIESGIEANIEAIKSELI